MHSFQLYYHTLKHMKLAQILGRMWLRVYRPRPDQRSSPSLRAVHNKPIPFCLKNQSMLGPHEFRFLNHQAKISEPADWDDPSLSKLWRYNLHYFDDLSAQNAAERRAWHTELIQRWITENPPGQGTGWEPYPTSLRIVNWIKWVLQGNEPIAGMTDSLATQVKWLKKRLEYHLLGNHLLANAQALVWAGLFFEANEAQGWYETGTRLLSKQLQEQVLADGGHFERSPMYHLIVLEDVLDLINIHAVYGRWCAKDWKERASRMLAWGRVMQHPDGEIPFFNDAACGVAPTPRQIDDYARELDILVPPERQRHVVHLDHSGYVRLECGSALVLADAGPLGPDYLPGHAHADSLSFELSLNERRVLVNSGTSTYEPGKLRTWQRSTPAHNTLCCDKLDSSEMWGAFRVARRAGAVVEDLRTERNEYVLTAAHDGYRRLAGKPMHRRTWQLTSKGLRVVDELTGCGVHAVDIFLHLHPTVLARPVDTLAIELLDAETRKFLAVIRWLGQGEMQVEDSFWYPEFNKAVPSQCCVLKIRSTALPLTSCFEVEWANELPQ
jgi:uncharacterized heparinase superfamily protein